jgi:ABC-type nitrate/sulfonate/bicarbonate transport system substrate-binding protein
LSGDGCSAGRRAAGIGDEPGQSSILSLLGAAGNYRIEDLRGKTLGVSRFGSVTNNLTRILLRRYKLEGAVQIRQMGGTTEMAAAFQRRQIDGAVISALRINVPMRMLSIWRSWASAIRTS